MKRLILITNQYPYLTAETFLENEILYLCEVFEEVCIFSVDALPNDVQTREVPSNVRCFPIGSKSSCSRYLKFGANGILTFGTGFNLHQRNPKKIMASCYIRGRGVSIAEKIHTILKDQESRISDTVIYSFWFAYQAVAAVLLGDMLREDGGHVAVVSRAHGYDLYWERVSGGYLPFQDVLLEKLEYCYPCSEYGRDYILKKYPNAGNKIITARLGTKDWGIGPYSGEKKVLVTCSNLEPLKRVSLFAKAFCLLCKEMQEIQWVCIGSGEEENLIKETIQENGCEERVRMLGRLPNSEIMEFYRNNEVQYFVNVSTTEGVPVTVMEAMSFGIPVIATDVGGTHELVDADNGFMLNADLNEIVLCGKLKDAIFLAEEDYRKLRIASREKWEKFSSAERNYSSFAMQLGSL